MHDKMRSVGDPTRPSLEEQQQKKEQEKQQRQTQKNTQQQQVVVSHLWQQQQQQSSCLSEAAGACEALSPCCCVCFYRGPAGAEIPHEREAERLKDEMYFYACGKSRQHPLKAAPYQTTNADAFLIDSQILGVADGVGSVETEGYDPALLPVELLTQCSVLFRLRQQNAALFDAESESLWTSSSGHVDGFDVECFPLHILARAHASCVSLGSTTCVLGMLDTKSRRLYTVNVGDSRLLLLRRVSKQKKAGDGGKEETAITAQRRAGSRDSLATGRTFSLLQRPSRKLTPEDAGTAGEAAVEHASSPAAAPAKEEQASPEEEREAESANAEPAAAAAGARVAQSSIAGERGTAAQDGHAPAEPRARSGVAQLAGTRSFAADGPGSVEIASPSESAAVVNASSQTARGPLLNKSVSCTGRNSTAAAGDTKGSASPQEQQLHPTSRHVENTAMSSRSRNGEGDGAGENERRLQAIEGDQDRRFMRDETQAGEKQEDSAPAAEKEGRQLREDEKEGKDEYQIVYRTEVQQHFFNCPYQLTRMPDVDCSQEAVLQRTQACADLGFCDVKGGDIVILGSDGLFDNLFEDDIVAVVNTFCYKGGNSSSNEAAAAPAVDPALIADQLLNMALAAAAGERADGKKAAAAAKLDDDRSPSSFYSSSPSTPFSEAAYKELGRHIEGGKPDDTTVVVAYVLDPQQHHVRPWQKQKRAQHVEKRCALVESGVASETAVWEEEAQSSQAASDVRRAAAVTAEARRENAVPVAARNTHPPGVSGSRPVPADATTAGKTGATIDPVDEGAAAATPPAAAAAAELSAAAKFATQRATTFSREEMGSCVSEEATQTSLARQCRPLLTSSVVAHGRCQTLPSRVFAAECSDSDCEVAVPHPEHDGNACAITVPPVGSLQKWSSTRAATAKQKAQNTKNVRHRVLQSEEGRSATLVAQHKEVTTGDPRATAKHEGRSSCSHHLLQKETRGTSGAESDLSRPPSVYTSAAADVAKNTSTKGQQQNSLHHSPAGGVERGVPSGHGTTAADIITATAAAHAETAVRLRATRGWCLFRQPQANPHNLTLVMRAAPTTASNRGIAQAPRTKQKTQSHLVTTDAKSSQVVRTHCIHEKTGSVDLPRTERETDTTRKGTSNEQHQQTHASASAAETGIIAAAGHSATNAAVCGAAGLSVTDAVRKTRLCASSSGTASSAAVAVKESSAFSREGGVASALLASATCRFRQYATAWSSVFQHLDSKVPTAAVRPPNSARATDGDTVNVPADKRKAAAARAAPVAAPTACAGAADAVPPAIGSAFPMAVGVASPAGSSRHFPLSMSTVLACSRKSFPPVNAASLMSLHVHPPATRLQRICAADKSQALTPAAVAAALGAGTSPACIAAVHMKILDRCGG